MGNDIFYFMMLYESLVLYMVSVEKRIDYGVNFKDIANQRVKFNYLAMFIRLYVSKEFSVIDLWCFKKKKKILRSILVCYISFGEGARICGQGLYGVHP